MQQELENWIVEFYDLSVSTVRVADNERFMADSN